MKRRRAWAACVAALACSPWFFAVHAEEAALKELPAALGLDRARFEGGGGAIDYAQAVENRDEPGAMSLVLILHGRSGCGDDNLRQLTTPGLRPLLAFVREHKTKTVVLVPQCPAGRDWTESDGGVPLTAVVAALVKEKCAEFGVAPGRCYVTGISLGGGGGYALMAREPDLFSRAVVVSAGGRAGYAPAIKADVLIFFGDQDSIIPLERARAMAAALRRRKNATVAFELLEGEDHATAAGPAYGASTWRWLFQGT